MGAASRDSARPLRSRLSEYFTKKLKRGPCLRSPGFENPAYGRLGVYFGIPREKEMSRENGRKTAKQKADLMLSGLLFYTYLRFLWDV